MPRPVGVGEITGLWTFLKSIDWLEERWLQGLVLFHILCSVTLILGRNYTLIQIIIFVVLLLLVFLSENINEWAAHNYKSFSSQQYFDSDGLFISVVFSLPALLNCFFIVMFWFIDTGKMMVKVKRAKVRQTHRSSAGDSKQQTSDQSNQHSSKSNEDSLTTNNKKDN
ncbi:transmembrane protein 18-like [Tubulanus polymorphus]|uniref:transmembrane protein 18-like n=1 Tax=Tubulanus polymorphus TaxID=672921 RepID=UPI003DA2516D